MTVFKDRPCLLQKYRDGDRAILELVYRHYVQNVRRYISWQACQAGAGCGRTSVIEELCQDVFVKAYSAAARESFDGSRAYWPYLKAIARNTVIDFLRSLHTEVEVEHCLTSQERPIEDHTDECLPQVLSTVGGYLEDLPLLLRRVYRERFILEHSQEATARNLELSRNRVRTLEEQLRVGLKKRLNACGVFELYF